MLQFAAPLLAVIAALSPTRPDEGMWMPFQVPHLDWEMLERRGMHLQPYQLFDPKGGPSLQHAIARLDGGGGYGTAGFVSDRGLLLTNHHVAFGMIQSQSSVENNYIRDGFLARALAEELPCPGFRIRILDSVEEVTAEVFAGLTDEMPAQARYEAIERARRKMQQEAEASPDHSVEILDVNSGTRFFRVRHRILKDVRIVYAPPRSIGEYGGDVDNWMWPRHSGDFSFVRAFVAPDGSSAEYDEANVPYRPAVHLPLGTHGVRENDLVFILGFPGSTFRYRTSWSIRHREERMYPAQIATNRLEIDLILDAGSDDEALAIEYADDLRGLQNQLKNNQGMLDGMRRTELVARAREREEELMKFLATKPELEQAYGDILPALEQLYQDLWTFEGAQNILQTMLGGSALLSRAVAMANIEKLPEGATLFEDLKPHELAMEKIRLTHFFERALALPETQRIEALKALEQQIAEGENAAETLGAYVDGLLASAVLRTDGARRLLELKPKERRADPAVDLAARMEVQLSTYAPRWSRFVAGVFSLRPRWMQAIEAWKGPGLYPDANATLRFTHGLVRGYEPRDGVHYGAKTALSGLLEKDTGEEPFDAPEVLLELARNNESGPWGDPDLEGRLCVNFLSDTDITGGNSGSPVLNGWGEVVGVAFDGVYESMISDYRYLPMTRTISVDIRYVLFILDRLAGATEALAELNIG